MLFFLRKLIEALLLPIGFSGLLVVAGIVVRHRAIALVGVIILYTFSTQCTGRLMMRPLESAYVPMAVDEAPNADAIVVLSGSVLRGITVAGVQWGESASRYFAGIDLARARKAKVIVISAGLSPREGEILRRDAIARSVPAERIIVTPRVQTTEDEARRVSEIPDIKSILLVTSAFHMPRAALLFRSRGLRVLPFPTDERVMGSRAPDLSEFIPYVAPLQNSDAAMREYYGLAIYHLILLFWPGYLAR